MFIMSLALTYINYNKKSDLLLLLYINKCLNLSLRSFNAYIYDYINWLITSWRLNILCKADVD